MSRLIRPVYKTTIQVVIYSETSFAVTDCSLQELAESIDDGDNIGDWTPISSEVIIDQDVLRQELLAIGNDGEFFVDLSEKPHGH